MNERKKLIKIPKKAARENKSEKTIKILLRSASGSTRRRGSTCKTRFLQRDLHGEEMHIYHKFLSNSFHLECCGSFYKSSMNSTSLFTYSRREKSKYGSKTKMSIFQYRLWDSQSLVPQQWSNIFQKGYVGLFAIEYRFERRVDVKERC